MSSILQPPDVSVLADPPKQQSAFAPQFDPVQVASFVEALRQIGLTAEKVADAIRQGTKEAILEARD